MAGCAAVLRQKYLHFGVINVTSVCVETLMHMFDIQLAAAAEVSLFDADYNWLLVKLRNHRE